MATAAREMRVKCFDCMVDGLVKCVELLAASVAADYVRWLDLSSLRALIVN